MQTRGSQSNITPETVYTSRWELSVDIAGPYAEGIPVTDRPAAKQLWPMYLLVGAFVPFGDKEAKARYEQEVKDRREAGLEGPVQLETATRSAAQTLYFVESIPSKNVGDTTQAIMRSVNRIENSTSAKRYIDHMQTEHRN